MSELGRRASVFLTDDGTLAKDIDFVFEQSIQTRHPVYLFIPMDTPDIFMDGSRPDTDFLNREITNTGHEAEENEAVESIMGALSSSRNGALLFNVLSQRYGLSDEVNQISQHWSATVCGRNALILDTIAHLSRLSSRHWPNHFTMKRGLTMADSIMGS